MKQPNQPNNCGDNAHIPLLAEFRARQWQEMGQERELVINFPIDDATVELITLPILNINKCDDAAEQEIIDYPRVPITIYINTDGGDISAAFSVISAIEASKTPVITVALGKAISAGFLILLAGHHRQCQKYSECLYHQGAGGANGYMKFADWEESSEYFQKTQDRIHEYVLSHTKITREMLDSVYACKHDWHMDAITAYQLGVVDEILGVDMDKLQKSIDIVEKRKEKKAQKQPGGKKAGKKAVGEPKVTAEEAA